ncbi:MAG: sulfatase-like hydrolase/transferase [Candidatus Accumulibacter sp.]|jgi:arylsulfatase A-like enzyme|nr:sulfatase-like hydrolase/transferase [Accumulibacter sp.]
MTERKQAKNVLFIMLDTLAAQYLGCYGNSVVKTPNIDRLARNATLFENAYSEGLPTIPARRALMTGRFTLPFDGWRGLNEQDTTLTDMLWCRWWQTALIYDTPPMRIPKYAYSRGFDYVRFLPGHDLDHVSYAHVPLDKGMKPEDYTSPTMLRKMENGLLDADSEALLRSLDLFLRVCQDRRGDADSYVAKVASAAEHWLTDIRDKRRPFVLWVDSFDPHEPWDPPSVWAGEPCPYDPGYEGNPLVLAPWTPVEGRISERECAHVRALYYEKISVADKWVGRLLDTLEREGLADDTLVIFTSDHGQPMGDGMHGHGLMRKCRPWPYEEVAHIPLIIRMPGAERGRRVQAFVQNADILPTLLDALGLLGNMPPVETGTHFPTYDDSDIQGESLLPLLYGETDGLRDHAITGYFGKAVSIVTEDYSYIHWLAGDVNEKSVLVGEIRNDEAMWTCTLGAKLIVPKNDQLFDRRKDPQQLNDIIDREPEAAERMLRKLKLRFSEIRST